MLRGYCGDGFFFFFYYCVSSSGWAEGIVRNARHQTLEKPIPNIARRVQTARRDVGKKPCDNAAPAVYDGQTRRIITITAVGTARCRSGTRVVVYGFPYAGIIPTGKKKKINNNKMEKKNRLRYNNNISCLCIFIYIFIPTWCTYIVLTNSIVSTRIHVYTAIV